MRKKVVMAAAALIMAGSASAQVVEMKIGDRTFQVELNGNDAP